MLHALPLLAALVFYCPTDGTGPLLAPEGGIASVSNVDRAACPSHVVRNGRGPRVAISGGHRALRDGEAVVGTGSVDAHGGRRASLASGEPVVCPEDLVQLRVVDATAHRWVPPGNADAPTTSLRFLSGTKVIEEASFDAASWTVLGRLVTDVGGLTDDPSRAVGAIIGEVEATGGQVELRLVAAPVGGLETVVASGTFDAGTTVYRPVTTAVGALPVVPASYRIEGRTRGATAGAVRGMSLALYVVE